MCVCVCVYMRNCTNKDKRERIQMGFSALRLSWEQTGAKYKQMKFQTTTFFWTISLVSGMTGTAVGRQKSARDTEKSLLCLQNGGGLGGIGLR